MRIRLELDLPLPIGGASARPVHWDTPAAERDLTALVAVSYRGAVGVVLAARANHLVQLGLHQLVQHTEADPTSAPGVGQPASVGPLPGGGLALSGLRPSWALTGSPRPVPTPP